MTTMVYMEGGAPGGLAKDLRNALRKFLERAGVKRQSFQVTACGGRVQAYERFSWAIGKGKPSMLLVDAEETVTASGPWDHLHQRAGDHWTRPDGTTDDQCHLMAQVMESWFLADAAALRTYYGQGFLQQSLPTNPDVEQVNKKDVLDSLTHAARPTQKREYSKGRDSFKILERIDPEKVRKASYYANRFLQALGSHSEP